MDARRRSPAGHWGERAFQPFVELPQRRLPARSALLNPHPCWPYPCSRRKNSAGEKIMPDRQYDVFLSHNAKDKPRVRRLAERLKQAGLQTEAGLRLWFDEWNVRSRDIIALKVDEGLEPSRVLLLCLSQNALASGWVALERSTAMHRDPSNAGRRFIPLLLADCDLPDTLRRYKDVDFREEAEAAFAERVGGPPREKILELEKVSKST